MMRLKGERCELLVMREGEKVIFELFVKDEFTEQWKFYFAEAMFTAAIEWFRSQERLT